MSDLVLKSQVTQKKDGTELYIKFREATGDYNVDTNPGGFGAPNPERSDVAILFYGLHRKSDGDVELTPLAYDPATATMFTFTLADRDGHWKYWIFALPYFDELGVYAEGDIVYNIEDPVNPVIQKYIAGSFQTVPLSTLTEEVSVDQMQSDTFPVPEADSFVKLLNANQLLALKKLRSGQCGKSDWEELNMQYVYAFGTLDSATLNFCKEQFTKAQEQVEEVLDMKAKLDL